MEAFTVDPKFNNYADLIVAGLFGSLLDSELGLMSSAELAGDGEYHILPCEKGS